MVYHGHILGHVVRELRRLATVGAPVRDLLAFLEAVSPDDPFARFDYLQAAFLQKGSVFTYLLMPNPSTGESLPEATIEKGIAERVQEHKARWSAESFPELMRLRDYLAFLEFARSERLVIVVCGANPFSGRFIGREGFRCFD